MSDIYRFPGAFVWKKVFANHGEFKQRLLPLIVSEAVKNKRNILFKWEHNNPSTVTTNYLAEKLDPHCYFSKEDIQKIALESAYEFAQSRLLPGANFPSNFMVKEFWWNRYNPGESAPPHTHSGCLSGVYILEQTEPCPLKFLDVSAHSPDPEQPGTYYNSDANEGEILIFPGSLTHWVQPVKAARTTISFNLAPC